MELEPIEFLRASAETGLRAAAGIDPAAALLIVDPPRGGLTKSLIDAVCKWKPANVIYISCAADTLARDLAQLASGGYQISSTQLFDMFPRTPYFETVAHLTREKKR